MCRTIPLPVSPANSFDPQAQAFVVEHGIAAKLHADAIRPQRVHIELQRIPPAGSTARRVLVQQFGKVAILGPGSIVEIGHTPAELLAPEGS